MNGKKILYIVATDVTLFRERKQFYSHFYMNVIKLWMRKKIQNCLVHSFNMLAVQSSKRMANFRILFMIVVSSTE